MGVHYMTVYRYVRQGRLPARRDGTEWRVDVEAIDGFKKNRAVLSAMPGGGTGGHGDGGSETPWAERLVPCLAAGDEPAAWGLIEQARASGRGLAFCYFDMIAPALLTISKRADADHTSTAGPGPALALVVAQRLVARLGPGFRRPGRTRGDIVLGAPVGGHHQLPLSMIADLVRAEGFGVLELGTDVSPHAFVEVARSADRLLAIGVGVTADQLVTARATVALLRAELGSVPIVVGGRAIRGAEVTDLDDIDRWVENGRSTVQALVSAATELPSATA